MVASARCSGARPKLRTRLFRISAFDRMICSPLSLRSRVVLMPMCSTVPVNVSIVKRIADDEGLVQRDRQRGEQIAEHVLQSQRHRDAADAQAGEQRGDVDAEVLERDQDQQGPDQHARDEIDDVQRARETRSGAALQFLDLQIEAQRPTGPQADLQQE